MGLDHRKAWAGAVVRRAPTINLERKRYRASASAVFAATIDQRFGIKGKAHGQKGRVRGYPLKLGAETFDLSQFISALASSPTKIASDEKAKYDALAKEATERAGEMNRPARIAIRSTTLAFVLLCIFAVKVLLSV